MVADRETQVRPHVVIVGGGLAGLAAATALATRDVRVTLLESRGRLGGRASSIVDRETGQTIDNCQHVVMGCCTNFWHWCETIGCTDLFEPQQRLFFVSPPLGSLPLSESPFLSWWDRLAARAGINRLLEQCGLSNAARARAFETRQAEPDSLPAIAPFESTNWFAPLHLAASLSGFSWIAPRDQHALAGAIVRLALAKWGNDESFAYWLSRQGQSAAVIESFWKPVLVSALSESFERISLKYARKVLVDGFLAHRDGWRVLIPKVPLDEIYDTRLTKWLAQHAVDWRLHAGVSRIFSNGEALLTNYRSRRASNVAWQAADKAELAADELLFMQHAMADGLVRMQGVELRDGEQLTADQVILAVPQHLVAGIVPTELQALATIRQLEQIETAPIGSVHLWLDRAITDLPHAVLVNRLSQWLFGRGRSERGYYYQVVISAAFDLASLSEQDVLAHVMSELAEVWPEARAAQLLHGRLITEHKAVFSPRPEIDALRPVAQSPIRNLHFAGDWTRTGWPSTMEGAVRSGYLAAESVLRRLGHEETLLQPDLPTNWLTRWLA